MWHVGYPAQVFCKSSHLPAAELPATAIIIHDQYICTSNNAHFELVIEHQLDISFQSVSRINIYYYYYVPKHNILSRDHSPLLQVNEFQ